MAALFGERASADAVSRWAETVRETHNSRVERQALPAATYVEQRAGVYDKRRPHPLRQGHGRFAGMHPVLGKYVDPARVS
jgi:hypothetical protein